MAATALVNFDFDSAEMAIRALDAAGRDPDVALWAKLPDYESWRLVIASTKIDQDSPLAGYRQINEALERASIPVHRQPTILLRPMRSPMIKELLSVFGKTASVYGMRLGGQTFGDKYIEDALVYRIR